MSKELRESIKALRAFKADESSFYIKIRDKGIQQLALDIKQLGTNLFRITVHTKEGENLVQNLALMDTLNLDFSEEETEDATVQDKT